MGSSSSKQRQTPVQEAQTNRSNLTYTCSIIDDESINYVIRENLHRLTWAERAMAREAQSLATQELNRTMRNCELVMYLDNTTIRIRAGNCDNRIIMLRKGDGEIEWKFTKRSFTQTVYSGVRWVGQSLLGFFGSLLPIAGQVVESIGWL
ncbi:uncharacterized protein LOC132564707 [Ylistrum balloti]|uniref:uncharacterized protein LOC132564707 n=1 Tax=Ylistrum balloti TaxID=509963 RepID=UPI002905C390|nr:uncharacterized protein LOC132564707 [Ylistrum balloti]